MTPRFTAPSAPIHPDDVLFFADLRAKMFEVAGDYRLRLRSVSVFPMPEEGMADCKGDCLTYTGDIRLVLRCATDGIWAESPRTPDEVVMTAAHELAHLRYANHGEAFQELRLELYEALANKDEDYREKLIAKLVKMQASRDGEAALGNTAAAEAFAGAINRMLVENELSPSDLDYARATDRDPVIQISVNYDMYRIEKKNCRCAWMESLARIVANAHLCSFLVTSGSNKITFVGTKSHATVAEYAFGVLAPAAEKMSFRARHTYREELRAQHGIPSGHSLRGIKEGFGFREAWLMAFVGRIGERFEEARSAAVAAAPEGTSTALMRLDGALSKVRKYMDEDFKGGKAAVLSGHRSGNNAAGRAAGRAAADAIAIGRKGVTSGSRGLLGK